MKVIVSFFVSLVVICLGTAGVVVYAVNRGYSSMAELSADLPSMGKVVTMLVCTVTITVMVLWTGRALAHIKGR